jgi:hydrogenase maturation protein HypF
MTIQVVSSVGSAAPAEVLVEALVVHVSGIVQGVGFRPFVHRLAAHHELAGTIRNESGEVYIQVEGRPESLDGFVAGLQTEAPPLARIDTLRVESGTATGRTDFRILPSLRTPDGQLPVSPDVAVCPSCAAELTDPADRRYRYPFITCTDCGPRFTVIETMPYDRERTSMRPFEQCPACAAEYSEPTDRRYHSETNSCAACGPSVWLESRAGVRRASDDAAVVEAGRRLRNGQILALRGLGGYHLATDATRETAVRRLRERKSREVKPLAVMVSGIAEARALAFIGEAEERLLLSAARPIVLVRLRPDAGLAPSVSPGLNTVGVMIAYTPLHSLLLGEVGRPLVMTSGNRSDLPIVTSNAEARTRLSPVADALLMHDREIVARYDDSVLRVMDGEPVFIRRARGFSPLPVKLPIAASRPLLAVGPHLKNTFTLAHGSAAFVSQHIGDLENVETLGHFRASLARYRELFDIEPVIAVRDLHPGYLSTRVADELGLQRTIAVQHHHAHVAAVAAEHGVTDPVVGIAFDGTGYGDDGRTWGAEILVADLRGYERFARMRYAPMPGGDLAARRPWRAAAGFLSLDPRWTHVFRRAFCGVPIRERELVSAQIERHINSPEASSVGRLFDAAAAVLGLRGEAEYEGQAAMELEALASEYLGLSQCECGPVGEQLVTCAQRLPWLPFPASQDESGVWVMDPLPLLAAIGSLAGDGANAGLLAAAFHASVARCAVVLAARACDARDIRTVVLGGGVFQNGILLPMIRAALSRDGYRVLVPQRLGPNDGAISYGQAAVAAALMQAEAGDF